MFRCLQMSTQCARLQITSRSAMYCNYKVIRFEPKYAVRAVEINSVWLASFYFRILLLVLVQDQIVTLVKFGQDLTD